MNGCNGHRELTETMLKMALNMKGLNQSLQTTQIKFDPNSGINLYDWVKLGLLQKKEKMRLTVIYFFSNNVFKRFLHSGR